MLPLLVHRLLQGPLHLHLLRGAPAHDAGHGKDALHVLLLSDERWTLCRHCCHAPGDSQRGAHPSVCQPHHTGISRHHNYIASMGLSFCTPGLGDAMLSFIQETEKCHAAVPPGGLLLSLPPRPALRHLLLLVAPSCQGPCTAKEESSEKDGETQGKKASRYTKRFSLMKCGYWSICSPPSNEGDDAAG